MIIINPTDVFIKSLNEKNEFIDGFAAPTVEEFFTEEFFEKDFLDSLYESTKDLVQMAFNQSLVLDRLSNSAFAYCTHIGSGCTTANNLIILYWLLIITRLKDPWKVLGVSRYSPLAIAWLGLPGMHRHWKESFLYILDYTKFFKKDCIDERQYHQQNSRIVFNNIYIINIHEKSAILGVSFIGGICEFEHFLYGREQHDASEIVLSLLHRIQARFFTNPFCKLIMNYSGTFTREIIKDIPINYRKSAWDGSLLPGDDIIYADIVRKQIVKKHNENTIILPEIWTYKGNTMVTKQMIKNMGFDKFMLDWAAIPV